MPGVEDKHGGMGLDFLLISIGSHGDVHPFVGLGSTLRSRGHRVTMITNPHFEPLVRKCGLDFLGVGKAEDYHKLASNPDLWRIKTCFETVMNATVKMTPELFDLVSERVVPGETVVASSSLAFGARIAQDKLKFPMATIHLSPAVFRSSINPPMLPGLPPIRWLPSFIINRMFLAADRLIIDKLLAPPINAIRNQHGLPPVYGILREWWNSPDLVIGMFPEWFAAPQKDWPPQTKLTGFPLWDERSVGGMPQELYDFLNAGEPPVVFTPGSAMWQAQKFFEACIDSCDRLNRRGILLTRHRDHLPANLPNFVKHFDYAPFSQLLPSVACLVHHGGIGTSAQAMRAGVRQVVTPMAHDQLDNAARMEKLGIARVIPAAKLTGARLAKAIKSMFDNRDFYVRAHWVSEWFAGDQSLIETAKLVEQLGKSHSVKHPQVAAVG
jgi:UDP:flavonoid glycosyltransferase YjiC (YdhE family)